MRQPSRRAFVSLSAGFVGSVAGGCLGRDTDTTDPTASTASSPSTRTTGSTPASPGTKRTVHGVDVAVSDPSVQDSVLYLSSPDSMAVATPDEGRYVLVTIRGSESGPPPTSFALVVDGDRYPGRVDDVGLGIDLRDRGATYDPSFGTDRGWVAFVVPPALDAREGRIVLDHGGETAAWRLGDDRLAALRRGQPRFELRTVDIPERVAVGGRVSVRVVAENVSEVAGVFRGVRNVANLRIAYTPYPFALETAPGETADRRHTFERVPERATGEARFVLESAGDGHRIVATTTVREASGTGGRGKRGADCHRVPDTAARVSLTPRT